MNSKMQKPLAKLWLKILGDWLLRHQRVIRITQWMVVIFYLVLIIVPAILPLPGRSAYIWDNLTVFAQFVFWGIWWPFVLLSMVLVGRTWCGIFCPEGTLTEAISHRGLGRAIPKWLKWPGWPFVAFSLTTIYGQMISVYQYPKAVLIILGGSTLAAMVIGFLYGRRKRVWCRYLCPVNGVFKLLAKLAPVHYRVDQEAWLESQNRGHEDTQSSTLNCAPMVVIRQMQGASDCHMCGRCQGFRQAVELSVRSPNHEILNVGQRQNSYWDTILILFGLMGIASAAFQWSGSSWYVTLKQLLAEWLINHDILFPITLTAPWWILTNYPLQNDVMTLLDGMVLLGYIGISALLIGSILFCQLVITNYFLGPWSWQRFHHLVQAFIPLAGCGVFLGLFGLTIQFLKREGIDVYYLQNLRILLLIGAGVWSLYLGVKIIHQTNPNKRKYLAYSGLTTAVMTSAAIWVLSIWPKTLNLINLF